MNKLIFVFLISAMHLLTVSENLKLALKVKYQARERWSNSKLEQVIVFLEGHPYLSFSEVMGAGSFGIVFKASKKDEDGKTDIPRAFKLQFDSINFSAINELMYTYKKVKSTDPDSYVIQMQDPYKKNLYVDGVKTGFAGIEMELGMPGEKVYFTEKTTTGKNRNTKRLYEFFVKLIKGFNYFNQVKGFYHADVKPDNWLVIPQPDGSIEPRIIDFDLIFRHPKLVCQDRQIDYYQEKEPKLPEIIEVPSKNGRPIHKKDPEAVAQNLIIDKRNEELRQKQSECNPNWVVYTLDYRAPELKAIVWNTNYEERKDRRDMQKRNWIRRTWSSRFMEEAWSVGKSMHEAIITNQDYLDQKCPEFELLADVIHGLKREDKNKRLTLEAAFKYLEDNKPKQRKLI